MQRETKAEKDKEIREYIEKRFALETTNPKKVLNSLLERPHNKIKIDRVLVSGKEKFDRGSLIVEKEEVKAEVIKHFQEQFRKRNHTFDKISGKWEKVYKEQNNINEEWYSEVMKEITEEEWIEVTNTLQKDTAPGISGIGYRLINQNLVVYCQRSLQTLHR